MLRSLPMFAAALAVALGPLPAAAQTSASPEPSPAPNAPAHPPPAPAGTRSAAAPLYLIVPFGEPGDTDPVLFDSTRKFSEDLSARGVRSALGVPTDAVEAVANARADQGIQCP
jgi:hypothetical protein